MRETFTDADHWMVGFEWPDWSPDQRAVIFAAPLIIDFFENKQQSGGLLDRGSRGEQAAEKPSSPGYERRRG